MDKNTIIYIGDAPKMVSFIQNHFNILQAKDIAEFYKKYDSLKLRHIHSLIVDFWNDDVRIFLFHTHNAELFVLSNIPFILYAREPISKKNKSIARAQGIDDIIVTDFNEEALLKRLEFLKNYHSNKVQKITKRNTEGFEVSIPLWKRLFDIVVSSIAIILLSPVFLLIIILLKLESKGPIFYISKRVGMGYKMFDFYKFRSMYVDADQRLKDVEHLNQYAEEKIDVDVSEIASSDADETMLVVDDATIPESEYLKRQKEKQEKPFVKIKNDPRITKVGRFIRKTSLDELPQLFNVLKGDMSIVGNRPIPLYEAEMLTSDRWAERFLAPAGITGLWQVTKRGKANMSNEERKELDNIYARNYSFWYDMKIILKTFKALLQTENV